MSRPPLSIIIPFLNEEGCLPLLRQSLDDAGLPEGTELLLVDDGSTDGGTEWVRHWAQEDRRVRLIRLTRNFGHQPAISAGLDQAQGAAVGIMDADLQDEPGHLLEMWKLLTAENWDVVYAVRATRSGHFLKRIAYFFFYRIYAALSDIPAPLDSGDFCVMTFRACDLLRQLPEKSRFLRGLRAWIGLRQKSFPVDRGERAGGRPKYSFRALLRLAVHGLTSFSLRPLRWVAYLGVVLCLLSVGTALVYLASAIFSDVPLKVPGFSTLVIFSLFLHGITLLSLGIIGEYLGTVFTEVKRRPFYLIDTAEPENQTPAKTSADGDAESGWPARSER